MDTSVVLAIIGIAATIVGAAIAAIAKLYADVKRAERELLDCERARRDEAKAQLLMLDEAMGPEAKKLEGKP